MDGNLQDTMKTNILASDSYIVFGTPRYQARAADPKTNVAFEYRLIQKQVAARKVTLFPLLYAGEYGTSFPSDLMNHLIRDFRTLHDYSHHLLGLSSPLGLVPSIFKVAVDDRSDHSQKYRLEHDRFNAILQSIRTVKAKLISYRNQIMTDHFITNELSCYIAPNGEPFMDSPADLHEPVHEWVEKELLGKDCVARVGLLQGAAGAGKSTFNRHLARSLWQDTASLAQLDADDSSVPCDFVPILIPLGSNHTFARDLFSYLTHSDWVHSKFTAQDILTLQNHFHVLFIADGYDEMPETDINLSDSNRLDEYAGRVKLLIGCRTQHVLSLTQELKTKYFALHGTMHTIAQTTAVTSSTTSLLKLPKELHLVPFNESQIKDYIDKYLHQHANDKTMNLWSDYSQYKQHFDQQPKLPDLITTPFILQLILQVLPAIVQEAAQAASQQSSTKTATNPKHESIDTVENLTLRLLYEKFSEMWFKRQAAKYRLSCHNVAEKDLIADYTAFCGEFARLLYENKLSAVQYPVVEKYTPNTTFHSGLDRIKELFILESEAQSEKEKNRIRGRFGCPMRVDPGNYYSFIHASLADYFVTSVMLKEAQQSQATQDLLLSSRILTPDLYKFLADRVKEGDEDFKKYLLDLIMKSIHDASLTSTTCASNALTILNAANVDLSGYDFSGIRCPYAGALLHGTKFVNADLSSVNLTSHVPGWQRQTFLVPTWRACAYFHWPF
eukprot:TRINITY_DN2746_c1_g1::TRINITY_DN2746_c1_g1_i1::g.27563::m.27563 TRINITY_DN2746_c1_g1::TRINITY_DN2746_c1_g1_i1::g.27563  ORF type:complete len:830 (-),score=157.34,NACHT/PF05729.7/1.3e-07,NACHT/PF05729.7/1.8e+03,TIR_2/PF13676.1/0.0003,AAA_16/PF13191.1/0.0083,AAA_16/PF13191.1/5.6e+03,Pentapeptide/PF00805.17/4.2e+02,Pentapeptide/PF00805.17/0.11,AAA_22/PF13401.1/0.048,UPF0079/PF02367.12/0.21,UPF0079/PF02367.12/2.2e+03,UPF0731/PF14982.1/0.59,UPF0731/PF14982.1/5.8e+03 TRINITY_DN2746_c1_g1_i1:39-2219(-